MIQTKCDLMQYCPFQHNLVFRGVRDGTLSFASGALLGSVRSMVWPPKFALRLPCRRETKEDRVRGGAGGELDG